MGSFNDLPKDVLWMIFRVNLIELFIYRGDLEQWHSKNCLYPNPFAYSLQKASHDVVRFSVLLDPSVSSGKRVGFLLRERWFKIKSLCLD
jgi:hypothetical protein